MEAMAVGRTAKVGNEPARREAVGAADLLPGRSRGNGERWHVLHVKSRQEKVLDGALARLGVASYLPLLDELTYHGRRKARVLKPLFPGYLFVWGVREQLFQADRTRRVAGILSVEDQERLEWELSNVNRALAADARLTPHPVLREGMRVRVRSGPLKDLEGLVKRNGRDDLLILQVGMLGSAASLEIARSLLIPLD